MENMISVLSKLGFYSSKKLNQAIELLNTAKYRGKHYYECLETVTKVFI